MNKVIELDTGYYKEKLDSYCKEAKISIDTGKKEEVVKMLVEGKFRDLGGLTAIRGFVYQYYVAMYYILDMINPHSQTWWDHVIYEFFDDVTLFNSEHGIRFIQVKTVREDSKKHLQPNDLYSRSKKTGKINEEINDVLNSNLNSWLDKLFLNLDNYNESLEAILGEKFSHDSFEIQFELGTNSNAQSLQGLVCYSDNCKFGEGLNIDLKVDTLYNNLKKDVVIKPKGTQIEYKRNIEELLPESVEWCLERFYINKLGSFDSLEKDILCIIQAMLKTKHEKLKHSIASHIFERLLSKLVNRTHKDNVGMDRMNLVFAKRDVQEWLSEWEQEAKDLMNIQLKDDSVMEAFTTILEELQLNYKEQWNDKLQNELVETTLWLKEQIDKEWQLDHRFLSNFLHKLFYMQNWQSVHTLERNEDKMFLKNSLDHIIKCLVFYTDKYLTHKNARFFFNEGKHNVGYKMLFSIYNARDKENTTDVKNKVIIAISECEISSKIKDDYFCIIINSNEDEIDEELMELMASTNIIETDTEAINIIDPPQNVLFLDPKRIERFFNTNKKSKPKSFKEVRLLNLWGSYIKK